MRLDPARDAEFMKKTIDQKSGRSLWDLHHEAIHKKTPAAKRLVQAAGQRRTKPADVPHVITDRVMKFTFPYPPSANGLYIIVILDNGKQKRLLSKEGKAYKRRAFYLAKQQGAFMMTGLVRLTFHVYRPRRSGDLTNRIKITEDSLKGVALYDDEQVAESHQYRHLDPVNPRIEITLEQIR